MVNAMKKPLRHGLSIFLSLCLSLCLLLPVLASADTLISGIDRSSIAKDETLTLTVTYDGDDNDAELDTRQLEQQFTILGRNRSSRVSITNGSMNNSSAWIFELQPKKSGQLLIPSFQVNGEFSEAITIDVSDKPANNGPDQNLYTEVEIDKPHPRVQEQVIVNWRLITTDMKLSRPSIDTPQLSNVMVYDLGTRQYQRSSPAGTLETVLEQRMAFFPQQSGTLDIPSLRFNFLLSVQRRFGTGLVHNAFEKRFLNTEPKRIEIAPAPQDAQNRAWMPAQAIGLSQQLTGLSSNKTATVGKVLTRTVITRSVGLMSEQLQAPDWQADGFKVYAEKPTLQNESKLEGVIGTRLDHVTLIPTRPGTLTLPALSIPWFNTASGQWETATLPAQSIDVVAGAATPQQTGMTPSAPATAAANNRATTPAMTDATGDQTSTTHTATSPTLTHWLQYYGWIIALVVLVTLALCLRIVVLQRQLNALKKLSASTVATPIAVPIAVVADKTLNTAAASDDARLFAATVLNWTRQYLPHHPPRNLQALAKSLPDNELRQQLLALDAALYGTAATPSLTAIAAALQSMTWSQSTTPSTQQEKGNLEPLYR